METISVVGLGKLGLPLAAAFADRGFDVIGVDINPVVVKAAYRSEPLSYEPGLKELLGKVGGKLVPTINLHDAVIKSDITIVIVATPSKPDGSFSLEYVLPACESVGEALRDKEGYHIVIISSTVMPGHCDGPIRATLEKASGKKVDEDIGLCCCPEFVAIGDLVRGFQEPDFVLLGCSDVRVHMKVFHLYREFCAEYVPIVVTSLVNAEIAKIALNCYVCAKITFANQLANLCEHIPGADVDEVTWAIGYDERVGHEYLKGATAYGGRCFPRDTRSLPLIAQLAGTSFPLVSLIHELNRQETIRLADIIVSHLERWSLTSVGILGLAFKPGTDVSTESAALVLRDELKLRGHEVIAYDPLAVVEESVESAQRCVAGAEVVVVVTPWPEFAGLHFNSGQVVVDCWRMLDGQQIEEDGALYVPIGRYSG